MILVMKMTGNRDILESILQTVQFGQATLRPLLGKPMNAVLRGALENQIEVYETIEMHAHALASQRGWELCGLHPIRQLLRELRTRFLLRFRCSDSHMAGMALDSSRHSRLALRKLRAAQTSRDSQIYFLSQKMLDCENVNICNMQPFL